METPRVSKSATDVGGYCSCIEYSAGPGPLILTGTSNTTHLYPPLTPSRPFPGNTKQGLPNGGNRLSTHSLITQLAPTIGSSNGRRLSHQRPEGGGSIPSSSPTSNLPEAMSCGAVPHSGDINCVKTCGNGRVLTCGSSGRLSLFGLSEACMPDSTTLDSNNDLGVPPSWYPEEITESSSILQDSLVGLDVDGVSGNVSIVAEGGRAAVVRLEDLKILYKTPYGGTLPLAGTAFQGAGGVVFATCGWAPHAQLQVWDARQHGSNGGPVARCRHPSPDPYLCIVNRPLTPEVFVVGTADGDVVAWDVRAPNDPLCNVKAGPDGNAACGAILGLVCHPQRPRHFLSCDEDGRLLLWDDPRDGDITCQMLVDVRQPLVGVCYDSINNVAFTITTNGAFYTCSCPSDLRV